MYRAIGMIELTSVARGIYATDQMLKIAYVDVVSATPVCPGKYIAIVQGDVAAVESSISTGIAISGEYLVDSFVLPNVHEGIFPAITATTMPDGTGALGIMESFSMASMITAADAALKAADVQAAKRTLLLPGMWPLWKQVLRQGRPLLWKKASLWILRSFLPRPIDCGHPYISTQ